MKKSVLTTLVVIVVVAVAVAAGAYLLLKPEEATPVKTTSDTTSSPTDSQPTASQPDATKKVTTITYSDSGFSPDSVTVKSGDTIEVKNTSSNNLEFESDPHPVHTDDDELNAGIISPGQSKSIVVTKKGSFGFHNHLNSNDSGKITIQ